VIVSMRLRTFSAQGWIVVMVVAMLIGVDPTGGEEDRTAIIDSAFQEYFNRGEKGREAELARQESVKTVLSAWNDDEVMEALIQWMFTKDNNPYIGYNARYFLESTNRTKGIAVLRDYLKGVEDSFEAYKLVNMAGLYRDESFIAESSHLLRNTNDGFARIQERPPQRICDVVYRWIRSDLRKQEADFEPIGDIPREGAIDDHERRWMIEWLAENWVGCEHLAASESRLDRSTPVDHSQSSSDSTSNARGGAMTDVSADERQVDLRWIVSGIVVFAFAVAYIIAKRHRSNAA